MHDISLTPKLEYIDYFMKVRAYGIYARVVGVSENSLVRYAHSRSFSDTKTSA